MKKIGLIAAAGLLAAAGAANGQQVILEIVGLNDGAVLNEGDTVRMGVTARLGPDAAANAAGYRNIAGQVQSDILPGEGQFGRTNLLTGEINAGMFGVGTTIPIHGLTTPFRGLLGGAGGDLGPVNGQFRELNADLTESDIDFTSPDGFISVGNIGALSTDAFTAYNNFSGHDPQQPYLVFAWEFTALQAGTYTITYNASSGDVFTNPAAVDGSIVTGTAQDGTVTFTVVPAPGAFALMGLGGLVAVRRRRR